MFKVNRNSFCFDENSIYKRSAKINKECKEVSFFETQTYILDYINPFNNKYAQTIYKSHKKKHPFKTHIH